MKTELTKQKIADILYSHIKQISGFCCIDQNDVPDIASEILSEYNQCQSEVMPSDEEIEINLKMEAVKYAYDHMLDYDEFMVDLALLGYEYADQLKSQLKPAEKEETICPHNNIGEHNYDDKCTCLDCGAIFLKSVK